ncbi:hypothetical protein Tco_1103765 [Tanacetum coccineum]
MVAYLQKSEGSEGFHEIIDFLTTSHIHHALIENPTLYASPIEQFWQTAALCTIEDGVMGLKTLPTTEIFEQLDRMGITSSPSLSPQTHPSTSQPQTNSVAEEAIPMPHESPLQSVHSLGRDEGSLSLNDLTGRKISDIDTDPTISLIQEEGMTWFQEDANIQEKNSVDTKILLQEEEPTELVENQGSREKGEKEVSTVGAEHSTIIPEVSTAVANLVYIKRSAKKRRQEQEVVAEDNQAHVIDWSDPAVLRYLAL